MVAFQGVVNRCALNAGVMPVTDLLAKRLERGHACARQMWRAAKHAGNHGIVRQRLPRIQPAALVGHTTNSGQLLATHQAATPDVAVRIALPHADKDLTVLKQVEPPVGHGHSVQKERERTHLESSNRVQHPAPVAPIRRSLTGSFTPVTDWRHNADPALAPMRRSSGGANTPIPEWLHNAGQ
jgi:hypothetical protein